MLSQREQELLKEIARLRRQLAREEAREYASGSVDTFTGLTDTPSAYTGSANAFLRVGSGTASVVFGTVDWADIYTKPSTFAPATHGSTHWSTGTDPVGTATPSAGAIPYADGSGLLDSWISLAGTATRGRAAFTATDFNVTDGTVAVGTALPRFSDLSTVGTSGSYNDLSDIPSTFAPSAHTIGSHSDVTIAGTASGDVLAHNGTAWVDETPITTSAGAGDAGKLVRLDAGGQVDATLINDADIDLDNVTEGTTNKFFTATEETKLAGIETAADVTDATNIASSIHGATAKTTPVDADTMPLIDSAASNVLKKVTWANIKATLKTYFDTLYNLYVHPNHSGDVTSAGDGATTIANDAVTNAKAANMAQSTVKGRAAGAGTGDPTDLSVSQLNAIIDSAAIFLLLAGRSGGQTAYGGTAANDGLTLEPTSHATKTSAYVRLAPSGGYVSVGNGTPSEEITVFGAVGVRPATGNANFRLWPVAGTNYTMFSDTLGNYGIYDATNAANTLLRSSAGQWLIELNSGNATRLGIKAGSSSNDAAVGGVLYVTTTQTGNVGTGEDDLASYSVPANTLSANGMSLWFEAWGTVAANIATKNIRVRFGTSDTNLIATVAYNPSGGGTWYIRGRIIRTGAATQKGMVAANGNAYMSTSLNQTLSGAVTLKVTGEATTTNDILLESFIVGYDDQNT